METTNELPQPKLGATSVQATTTAGHEDLSDAIEHAVERQTGEHVKAVRVFGDRYRCNWWIREKIAGPVYLDAGKIVRSKFFRATRSGDKLLLENLSITRPAKVGI